MSIEMVLHRVAVQPLEIDEWNEDHKKLKELGLAIAHSQETSRMKASIDVGKVLDIGPTAFQTYTEQVPIMVGDLVGYVKNSGKFVKNPWTSEEVYVLNDEDIVAVFKKETK